MIKMVNNNSAFEQENVKQAQVNYTVSQKNDNDVVHYNFNAHQPILVIFGRDIAERICY